ncbi:glycosyl transferase [Vibrio splendidus]
MSDDYNPLEKMIARVLSSSPGLKKVVKLSYSYIFYLLKKKNYKYHSEEIVEVIEDNNNETFFGYYDKTPDNGKGHVLVFNTTGSTAILPKNIDSIDLDVYCLKSKRFILSERINISAFNWQQANRAHWLDEDIFVYNNFDSLTNTYKTYKYSVSAQRIIDSYENAVQDSFKNEYMLSICYKSLALLRPDYGYFKHEGNTLPNYDETGIFKCDYNSHEEKMLFSVSDVFNFRFGGNRDSFRHKLNHVMISPNGELFIFMHRYYNDSGRRLDRLILANSNGELLRVLSDYQMVSHCFWYDETTILGYLRSPEGKDAYWLINVESGDFSAFHDNVFANRGDGHPSVNGDYIITDTYPNKSRMQSLFVTKKNSSLEVQVGEFFHGFKFSGETRCDLHPRFSKDGNTIFFDSIFSGKRHLCYIDINMAKKKLDDDI